MLVWRLVYMWLAICLATVSGSGCTLDFSKFEVTEDSPDAARTDVRNAAEAHDLLGQPDASRSGESPDSSDAGEVPDNGTPDASATAEADAGSDAGSVCPALYLDQDGDGYGGVRVEGGSCEAQAGQVERGGDCDDACPTCYPGALEGCDGIDNDCDGRLDNVPPRVCGRNIGVCVEGTQACESGLWSVCSGNIEASADDVCDGNNADEDCDGTVDENCACPAGEQRECGSSQGECTTGTQRCADDGTWEACVGAQDPQTETCDGRDNDCDGDVDEGLTQTCSSDIGACSAGVRTCAAGSWGSCSGVLPSPEACDGIDNDCDGVVDNGLRRACGQGSVGECRLGQQLCDAGTWGVCVGAVEPGREICDSAGRDENCDGESNEGCRCNNGDIQPCGTSDDGTCKLGSQTCQGGSWGACQGAVGPKPEVCDPEPLDEDCDGLKNEGCQCVDGTRRECGTNVGQCQPGQETCVDGRWSSCMNAVGPSAELCDAAQLDENCDGEANEGCICVTGEESPCAESALGLCEPGTRTCKAGVWGECVGAVTPVVETCDGRDEDCDGTIDNGDLCGPNQLCTGGACSCSAGYRRCSDDRCVPAEACCNCTDAEICRVSDGASRCVGKLDGPLREDESGITRPVGSFADGRNATQLCSEEGYGSAESAEAMACEQDQDYVEWDGAAWVEHTSDSSDLEPCSLLSSVECARPDAPR